MGARGFAVAGGRSRGGRGTLGLALGRSVAPGPLFERILPGSTGARAHGAPQRMNDPGGEGKGAQAVFDPVFQSIFDYGSSS